MAERQQDFEQLSSTFCSLLHLSAPLTPQQAALRAAGLLQQAEAANQSAAAAAQPPVAHAFTARLTLQLVALQDFCREAAEASSWVRRATCAAFLRTSNAVQELLATCGAVEAQLRAFQQQEQAVAAPAPSPELPAAPFTVPAQAADIAQQQQQQQLAPDLLPPVQQQQQQQWAPDMPPPMQQQQQLLLQPSLEFDMAALQPAAPAPPAAPNMLPAAHSAASSTCSSASSVPIIAHRELLIGRRLGSGSYGQVHAASWRGGRPVAVKTLIRRHQGEFHEMPREKAKAELMREAALMLAKQDKCVMRVEAMSFDADAEPSLILEFCGAGSLLTQLQAHKECEELARRHSSSSHASSSAAPPAVARAPPTADDVLRLLQQAAIGMACLHARHQPGAGPGDSQHLQKEQQQEQKQQEQKQQEQQHAAPVLVEEPGRLVLQLAAGSAAVPGVLHCDLRADNLLLRGNPRIPGSWSVKVADFGLSCWAQRSSGCCRALSVTNPLWLSPQLLQQSWAMMDASWPISSEQPQSQQQQQQQDSTGGGSGCQASLQDKPSQVEADVDTVSDQQQHDTQQQQQSKQQQSKQQQQQLQCCPKAAGFHVTPADDVWAFGCILWEVVTCGRAPYKLRSEDWKRAWDNIIGCDHPCKHPAPHGPLRWPQSTSHHTLPGLLEQAQLRQLFEACTAEAAADRPCFAGIRDRLAALRRALATAPNSQQLLQEPLRLLLPPPPPLAASPVPSALVVTCDSLQLQEHSSLGEQTAAWPVEVQPLGGLQEQSSLDMSGLEAPAAMAGPAAAAAGGLQATLGGPAWQDAGTGASLVVSLRPPSPFASAIVAAQAHAGCPSASGIKSGSADAGTTPQLLPAGTRAAAAAPQPAGAAPAEGEAAVPGSLAQEAGAPGQVRGCPRAAVPGLAAAGPSLDIDLAAEASVGAFGGAAGRAIAETMLLVSAGNSSDDRGPSPPPVAAADAVAAGPPSEKAPSSLLSEVAATVAAGAAAPTGPGSMCSSSSSSSPQQQVGQPGSTRPAHSPAHGCPLHTSSAPETWHTQHTQHTQVTEAFLQVSPQGGGPTACSLHDPRQRQPRLERSLCFRKTAPVPLLPEC